MCLFAAAEFFGKSIIMRRVVDIQWLRYDYLKNFVRLTSNLEVKRYPNNFYGNTSAVPETGLNFVQNIRNKNNINTFLLTLVT